MLIIAPFSSKEALKYYNEFSSTQIELSLGNMLPF